MDCWLKTGSLLEKRKSENETNSSPNEIEKTNIILPVIAEPTNNAELKHSSDSNSNFENKKWPIVWTESQWFEFKEKYPWVVSVDGKLGCSICSSITCLRGFKDRKITHFS